MRLGRKKEYLLLIAIFFQILSCGGEKMIYYHCSHCGKEIFKSEDIIKEVSLWNLKEYKADCFMIKKIIEIESFKRYDASLHEGWYCCRFIAMRMIEDKFGTGRELLVYKDSVVPVTNEDKINFEAKHSFPRLTSNDFENFIHSTDNKNKLVTIKFGAIWCPPCRLMDSVFSKIISENKLPNVVFSEVDIDEELTLASEFPIASIPFIIFFYNGKRIGLNGGMFRDNAVVGGLREKDFVEVTNNIFKQVNIKELRL